MRVFLFLLVCSVAFGCGQFDYDHYQMRPSEYENLNAKSIARVTGISKDTITIAVIGDSQRYYDETNEMVPKMNAVSDIDFVVHTGDIVDFGLQDEYIWMHEVLRKLRAPYIAVAGNHDLIAHGEQIYQQMYGPLNFSFTVSGNKFVYLNTNSREYGFPLDVPDLAWLDRELADTANYNNAIIVSHVAHINPDFNPNLRSGFEEVLRKYRKVILSVNGHNHGFSYRPPGDDNIAYINTNSTYTEKFLVIKIWGNSFSYEIVG